jgi:hypothetical protein
MAIEDADALEYVFSSTSPFVKAGVEEKLKLVEKIRYVRASTVQNYSRAQAVGPRKMEEAGAGEDLDPRKFMFMVSARCYLRPCESAPSWRVMLTISESALDVLI